MSRPLHRLNHLRSWFESLPIAVRSSSTAGFPSPLGGLTTEIFAGQEVPKSLIEFIEAFKNDETLTFLSFSPPVGVFDDKSLLKNTPLDQEIASRLLNKFKSEELLDRFLGSYFNEIKNFLDQDTLNRLNAKYACSKNCVEYALMMELKNLAAGNTDDLVLLNFKEQFSHLKAVYVWYKPGSSSSIYDKPFTIERLRILPGHFPTHPSDIDPAFEETYDRKNQVFKNEEDYYSKIHFYFEALLHRILNRLTLDKELMIQNYYLWKNTLVGNKQTYSLGTVLSESQLFELAKRDLAPGTTIVYDNDIGSMVIKEVTDSRVFRYGAFRTPIFLDPQLFQDGNKLYGEILEELNLEHLAGNLEDPTAIRRKIIEEIIGMLPKEETSQELMALRKLISQVQLGMRTLRILFEKI